MGEGFGREVYVQWEWDVMEEEHRCEGGWKELLYDSQTQAKPSRTGRGLSASLVQQLLLPDAPSLPCILPSLTPYPSAPRPYLTPTRLW